MLNKTYLANGVCVYSNEDFIVTCNGRAMKITCRIDKAKRRALVAVTKDLRNVRRSYKNGSVVILFVTIPENEMVDLLGKIKAIL